MIFNPCPLGLKENKFCGLMCMRFCFVGRVIRPVDMCVWDEWDRGLIGNRLKSVFQYVLLLCGFSFVSSVWFICLFRFDPGLCYLFSSPFCLYSCENFRLCDDVRLLYRFYWFLVSSFRIFVYGFVADFVFAYNENRCASWFTCQKVTVKFDSATGSFILHCVSLKF